MNTCLIHDETCANTVTNLERNPAEGHLKTVENDKELEETTRTREMHVEDLDKQKSCGHTPQFGAEFTSVDDIENVLVLSLPQFPLQSHLKSRNSIGVSSVKKMMDNSENREENMQAKGKLSPGSRSPQGKDFFESILCNLQKVHFSQS